MTRASKCWAQGTPNASPNIPGSPATQACTPPFEAETGEADAFHDLFGAENGKGVHCFSGDFVAMFGFAI